jgi:hypothetical protein
LLVGPTGVGKSSLSMQSAVCWALGKPSFGIAPARPLTSVIIQAENDAGDMAEMYYGVLGGLGLSEEERRRVADKIHCFQENARSGQEFFARTVEPLLRLHRPDLLWIDPALSYIAGESNSQVDVGRFLRNWLNPLLSKYQCGAIVAHHTNKPPSGKEKSEWTGSDLAYLGSGSAEWANWARAVVAVRSLGENGIFELCLGKRGGRVGWRNEASEPIYSTLIGHAKEPGRIYWRNAAADEIQEKSKGGAPRRFDAEKLLAVLAGKEMTTKQWQSVARDDHGVSRASFFRYRDELESKGKIHCSKLDGKWSRKP